MNSLGIKFRARKNSIINNLRTGMGNFHIYGRYGAMALGICYHIYGHGGKL